MSKELEERVSNIAVNDGVENKDNSDSDSESSSFSGSSSSDSLQVSSAAENSDKCAELGGEFTKIEKACLGKSDSVVRQHKAIIQWENSGVAQASAMLDTKTLIARTEKTEATIPPTNLVGSNKPKGSALPLYRETMSPENDDDEKNPIATPHNLRKKAKSVRIPMNEPLFSNKFSLIRDEDDSIDPDLKIGLMVRSVTEGPRKTIETKKVKKIKSKSLYINKYMLQERIGRGSSGTVMKCKDITTGKTYAMKILNKMNLRQQLRFERTEDNAIRRSSALDDVWAEIAIMKKLSHTNIVNLLEVIDSEKMVYLVLEYLPNGSIAESSPFIKKISDKDHPNRLRLYVRDMVAGLSYLHSQRICHSDIKPENILIDDDDILKLADFGLSKFLIQGQSRCVFDKKEGTPAFQAPECLNDSDSFKFSLFPTDVWALGVTIYQLKYGKLPFFSRNDEELTKMIKKDPIELPEDEDENLVHLLHNMLAKDPMKRITVKELCCHPWITNDGKLLELETHFELESVSATERSHAIRKHIDLTSPDIEQPQETRNRSRTAVSEIPSKPLPKVPSSRKLHENKVTNLPPTKEGNEEDELDEDSDDEKVNFIPSIFKRIKSAPMGNLFRKVGKKKKPRAGPTAQVTAIPSTREDLNFSQSKQKNDKFSFKKRKKVTFAPPLPKKAPPLMSWSTNSLGLDDIKEDSDRAPSFLNPSKDSPGSQDSGADVSSSALSNTRIKKKKKKKAVRVTFDSMITTFDPNSPPRAVRRSLQKTS